MFLELRVEGLGDAAERLSDALKGYWTLRYRTPQSGYRTASPMGRPKGLWVIGYGTASPMVRPKGLWVIGES